MRVKFIEFGSYKINLEIFNVFIFDILKITKIYAGFL